MSEFHDNQTESDERYIARITELEQKLADAQALINTMHCEEERSKNAIAKLAEHTVRLQSELGFLTASHEESKHSLVASNTANRKHRLENRALRIKLRAATKGAERNAYKVHGLFVDIPDVFSDNPTAMEIVVRMTKLKRKYDL